MKKFWIVFGIIAFFVCGIKTVPKAAVPKMNLVSKEKVIPEFKIEFRGNKNTFELNSRDRGDAIPQVIVDHITADNNFKKCDDWFRANSKTAAHFLIDKEGRIFQYVEIERSAYANGINPKNFDKITNNFIKGIGNRDTNAISVSIEHLSKDGVLTEKQITSSTRLHKHIKNYVIEKYDYVIKHVVGHSDIDPINKKSCPGDNFPWDKILIDGKI